MIHNTIDLNIMLYVEYKYLCQQLTLIRRFYKSRERERERFTEIERKEVKEKEFLSVMLELSQWLFCHRWPSQNKAENIN